MTRHRPHLRLFGSAAVALLILGGAACSDDDGESSSASSSTGSSTTQAPDLAGGDDDEGGSTTEGGGAGGSTKTTGSDEGSGTTTGSRAGPGGDLRGRLPQIPGYELELDDDDDQFDEDYCDDSTPTVSPVEQVGAEYERQDDDDDDGSFAALNLAAARFASEAEAGTYYGDFVRTASGCTTEGLTVDGGTDTGIGDEGQTFVLDYGSSGSGVLYVSLRADEVWVLSQFGEEAVDVAALVSAFTGAVEG